MAKAPSRIYIVTDSEGNDRLVNAQNPQQAMSHVASSTFSVRKATPAESFAAAQKGIALEEYKDVAQGELDI